MSERMSDGAVSATLCVEAAHLHVPLVRVWATVVSQRGSQDVRIEEEEEVRYAFNQTRGPFTRQWR